MKSLYVALFLFSILFSCSPNKSSENMKKNLVYVDSSDYDFGVIADSVRILKHSFVLYNTTLDTCLINRIVKSCGCTKVYCNKQIIPPEDSTIERH